MGYFRYKSNRPYDHKYGNVIKFHVSKVCMYTMPDIDGNSPFYEFNIDRTYNIIFIE
jgi:hypothetical protein